MNFLFMKDGYNNEFVINADKIIATSVMNSEGKGGFDNSIVQIILDSGEGAQTEQLDYLSPKNAHDVHDAMCKALGKMGTLIVVSGSTEETEGTDNDRT